MRQGHSTSEDSQRRRRRPRLWQEEELDHPWFHVDELWDVLRQAKEHLQANEHLRKQAAKKPSRGD